MPETNDETLPCADKLVFETIREAQATATISKHRYGGDLNIYHCRYCGLYHLSTARPD